MGRGKAHDADRKAEAMELFARDLSNAEVARKMGLPETTTYGWYKSWLGTPEFESLVRERRNTSAATHRRIRELAGVKLLHALAQDKIPVTKLASIAAMAVETTAKLEAGLLPDVERVRDIEGLSEDDAKQIDARMRALYQAEQVEQEAGSGNDAHFH